MTLSYRQQLTKISEPKPGQDPPAFPSGFYVVPMSMTALLHAMESPYPEQWTVPSQGAFERSWTEECQGVTNDGENWYISSNAANRQAVYRVSLANAVIGSVSLTGNGSGHLGAIAYHNGLIYCAMEDPIKVVLIPTPPFQGYHTAALVGIDGGAHPQASMPWCAVNPWNGLLYSSNNVASDIFAYRYDGSGKFVHVPEATIRLEHLVNKIQGGCFSKNGHLLLSSDDTNDIRCYSVLNGAFIGGRGIKKSGSDLEAEEVEGLTIWENIWYEGESTHVHVILLDNDYWDSDNVFFKHYHVSAWQNL